ncbi:MAG: hypothetical protein KGL10_01770 [Alphaproteobacteria bacterium]|nr:hypothetical protein [Alphaproteobacteria bacterium]
MQAKQILTAAVVAVVLSAGTAMAQTAAAPAPAASSPAATAPAAAAPSAKDTAKFEAYKKKTIERLEKRADDIQKKQACVTAANNPQQLKACFPKWHDRHGKGKGGK